VILPGSKNTIEDLIVLKNSGITKAVVSAYRSGKTVIGICGGFQMLGQSIKDPEEVESKVPEVSGIGLLPLATVLTQEKTTKQRTFRFLNELSLCEGYEIHMGQSLSTDDSCTTVNSMEDGTAEGFMIDEKCWGTYLHGILDNAAVINRILAPYTSARPEIDDYASFKDSQYDKLADLIRANVDMKQIYSSMRC
jgi:adenosylcobyric acid synthase